MRVGGEGGEDEVEGQVELLRSYHVMTEFVAAAKNAG